MKNLEGTDVISTILGETNNKDKNSFVTWNLFSVHRRISVWLNKVIKHVISVIKSSSIGLITNIFMNSPVLWI